jgi:hypothetical protein
VATWAVGEKLSATQRIRSANFIADLCRELSPSGIVGLVADLRDRLQVLLGFTEVLAEQSRSRLTSDQHRLVERVRLGLHGLELSVSNLSDAAHAVSRSDGASPQEFALGDLAAELLPALQYVCQRNRVAVKLQVKPPGLRIFCDWRRLRSIVFNLASLMAERLERGELTVALDLVHGANRRGYGRARRRTELEVRLTGRKRRAKTYRGTSRSDQHLAQKFQAGSETNLSGKVARYHVASLGGALRCPAAPAAKPVVSARIPIETAANGAESKREGRTYH